MKEYSKRDFKHFYTVLTYVHRFVTMNAATAKAKEGIGSPASGVKGDYEPPVMGAENCTQVLSKSSIF